MLELLELLLQAGISVQLQHDPAETSVWLSHAIEEHGWVRVLREAGGAELAADTMVQHSHAWGRRGEVLGEMAARVIEAIHGRPAGPADRPAAVEALSAMLQSKGLCAAAGHTTELGCALAAVFDEAGYPFSKWDETFQSMADSEQRELVEVRLGCGAVSPRVYRCLSSRFQGPSCCLSLTAPPFRFIQMVRPAVS